MKRKHSRTRCVCIDIDDTLIVDGKLNRKVVRYAQQKREDGFDLVLWSARGRHYAESTAERYGLVGLFDAIIGKPGYIVDDMGWSWTKYTRNVANLL